MVEATTPEVTSACSAPPESTASVHSDPRVDVEALMRSERRQRLHVDLIAHSTDVLGDLDYPYALRDMNDALRAVAQWSGVYRGESVLRYVEGVEVAAERTRRVAHVPEAAYDPARYALDGRMRSPALFLLDEEYEPGSTSAWLAQDIRQRALQETGTAPKAALLVTILGRRQSLGLLAVCSNQPDESQQRCTAVTRAYAEEQADLHVLLEVLARRIGVAMDNARLYAREHQLATALQKAALPKKVDVPGLDIWTYYAPAAEDAQIGGDWYDVMMVDERTVGVTIGDVVGHDAQAAAGMGQLRSIVRAYAADLLRPGVVIDHVDKLVAGMQLDRTASLIYATIRQQNARPQEDAEAMWTLRYTRAGHLPALLRRDSKVYQLDGASGPLIGYGHGDRKSESVELEPGDVLLFYTDGLVERRDRLLHVGVETLCWSLEDVAARDAAGIGEELLARLADDPEDDIALVVITVPDANRVQSNDLPSAYRWVFPHDLSSARRARAEVTMICREWGFEDCIAPVELAVSELITNAVRHSWGEIVMRLFDTGEGVLIEVEDENPAPPLAMEGHAGRTGGFGMSIIDRLGQWGWRPSGAGKIVWTRITANSAQADLTGAPAVPASDQPSSPDGPAPL